MQPDTPDRLRHNNIADEAIQSLTPPPRFYFPLVGISAVQGPAAQFLSMYVGDSPVNLWILDMCTNNGTLNRWQWIGLFP